MMDIKNYRDIPGYSGKYKVNPIGDVIRVYPSGKTRKLHAYHKRMNGSQRLVIKLSIDGKHKEVILMQVVALTYLGPTPEGYTAYHKDGDQENNCIHNIAYISRRELGKITGAKSKRRPVAKIDSSGEIIEVYPSARAASRVNHMSYQTVIDRCNGKCKSAFAPDGYAYAWDDDERGKQKTIRKIELSNGYMPKAGNVEFEW